MNVDNIPQVFKKNKLSLNDFIICLKEGLKAKKTIRGIDEDGEDLTEPDYSTRHKFFVSGMQLLGYLKNNDTNVNVNISVESILKTVQEAKKMANNNRVVELMK